MRLDLLRHGDTGRSGFLDGRTDCPLTPSGITQMDAPLAGGDWQLVVVSPLQRARSSAEMLAARAGCRLLIDADWAELDFGRWDGRRRSDLAADPEEAAMIAKFYNDPRQQTPPDGECWHDFEQRVRRGLASALDQAGGQRTLVITHAGPMRAALSIALGISLGSLWAVRIGYATRIGLELGRNGDGSFWGELVELVPP